MAISYAYAPKSEGGKAVAGIRQALPDGAV